MMINLTKLSGTGATQDQLKKVTGNVLGLWQLKRAGGDCLEWGFSKRKGQSAGDTCNIHVVKSLKSWCRILIVKEESEPLKTIADNYRKTVEHLPFYQHIFSLHVLLDQVPK
ncbi:uncharacterized protein [Montipora capricornis]|uniref:uncharacterized protein n=1 Tax=Montipora capricornis TaxID=246305 RepID=UPI0035F1B057